MIVPDARDWHPPLHAWLSTGRCAIDAVRSMPTGAVVAIDSETPSVTDSFTIKAFTAAWCHAGYTESVLLDPLRRPDDLIAAQEVCSRASTLVLQNAPFDIPGLVAGKVMSLDDCAKVIDTLIYARSAWPDQIVGKSLEDLAKRVLHAEFLPGGLALAIKAAGYRSRSDWFAKADIDVPLYRFGAMADTVITLRLLAPMKRIASDHQLNHPFGSRACTTRDEADALVHQAQRVNRITLRRAARGLAVDLDYLDTYRDTVDVDISRSSKILSDAGIRPGNGGDLMTKMDELGLIPPAWPRTEKTNKLSAAKEDIELLDHPLANAHHVVAHGTKMLGYLEKVVARSAITGRVHPQYNILGASATGRMSLGEPELQQFPKEARPIILEDAPGVGMTSIDWSSIEPCLMAWMANDLDFIVPFEQGSDLYAPIQQACGVPRKDAKVVLLAQIYGQGLWKMALRIKKSEEEAKQIKAAMFAAMPKCEQFLGKLSAIAVQHRMVPTLSGRIMTVPMVFDKRSGKKKVAQWKACNYVLQGGCADLIYSTILAAEDAGIGDDVMIPMHDEIVCATPAADEIERIMRTPPPSFLRWTDRTPTIRTDRADLANHWQAC